MSERRFWQLKAFGWGADDGSHAKNQQAFLNKYFPGRTPVRGRRGCVITASEEEISFCEFDCGAQFREVLQYA